MVYDDLNAPEVQARLRDLILLAKEQDYLTYDDINTSLPNGHITVDLLDEIITRLRSMEIRIVDESEVDAVKAPEPETADADEPEAEVSAPWRDAKHPVGRARRSRADVSEADGPGAAADA